MADILSQTLRLCFPPPIYSGLDMIANKRYRMDFCLCCTGTCYLSVSELGPDGALVCRFSAGVDPADAVDTGVDVGIDGVLDGLLIAAVLCVHNDGKAGVEICPGLRKALEVKGAQALVFLGEVIKVIHAAGQDLLRLALLLEDQPVGGGVVPLQGSLGADDADVLGGHVACVDSGGPHTAYSAALVFHEDIGIVFQRIAAAYEGLAEAEHLIEFQLGADQLAHVEGVGGKIAEDEASADLLGIDSPLLAFCLDIGSGIAAEAVCVAELDHVDLFNTIYTIYRKNGLNGGVVKQ